MSNFDWSLYPDAEEMLSSIVSGFLEHNAPARTLSETMARETGTRFFDWVDHVAVPTEEMSSQVLTSLGFLERRDSTRAPGTRAYFLPGSTLFPVLLVDDGATRLALKPENLNHFLQMNHLYHVGQKKETIEGEALGFYRRALVNQQENHELWAIERRGFDGFELPDASWNSDEYLTVLQELMTRRSIYNSDTDSLGKLIDMIDDLSGRLPLPLITDAFFRTERRFWQNKTRGGQVQKALQDRLGLGWGNHDHHTYRSSRKNFHLLIEMFEKMGFKLREKFFAGSKSGWGAQVLEHPICGITIFADVDITDEERDADFAHEEMSSTSKLGTVGLWVALHGESILQAGMHHLATRVDFAAAKTLLEKNGVQTLRPFSDFEFLKQSFTEAERRKVAPDRLQDCLSGGCIAQERHGVFKDRGAIGSHLEIIQRTRGFKGFNQDSVSVIIKTTDPRKSTERYA